MTITSYRQIVKDGLWSNNPGLVQLLGLCPLLAVSNTTVNALGLGLATLLVLLMSNIVVSLIRVWLRPEIRLPVFVLVIASLVTTVELLMNAFFHELHRILGIFIPLIVTNCAILGRAEAFASKNNVLRAALDGLMMGLGFTLVLIVLGALRELLGQGTLLSQAQLLFGEPARHWTLHLGSGYHGFLLALLPPGAFITLGFLLALKNTLDARYRRQQSEPADTTGLVYPLVSAR
jgi:electron transport complex protein RnfE